MTKLAMRVLIELLLALDFGFGAGETPTLMQHLTPTPRTITWGYFDARTIPVLRVRSGDTIEVEAVVAAGVQDMEVAGVPASDVPPTLREIDREVKDRGEIPHILTGPVYVQGAEPGDVLEVKILAIDPVIPYAVNFFRPGRGLLQDEFPYAYAKVTPLDLSRKVAKFSNAVEIPLRPFFGVIGVAPPVQTGRVSSGPPWIHAGNLDNKELVAGTALYIPVHVEGALLSIGDGHAGQGGGEVCLTALETSLRGTFQLVVHKGQKLRWPRAETPTHYMTMGFHEDLEEATKIAVEEMLDFLVSEKHLDRDDAYILVSDAVDLQITQLVDGKKGVHALLPKAIFVQHQR